MCVGVRIRALAYQSTDELSELVGRAAVESVERRGDSDLQRSMYPAWAA